MRVDIETPDGKIGEVTVHRGVAVPDAGAKDLLDELAVVEPRTRVKLDYTAGERYLRALPANLNGTYLWAVLSPRQAQIVKSDLGAADTPDQPR